MICKVSDAEIVKTVKYGHVDDQLLRRSGNDLIRTVVRTWKGDIRKKRAAKPAP